MTVFGKWFNFKLLDWIWGNGESAWKLLRAVFFILATIALLDAFVYGDPSQVGTYFKSIGQAPQTFLGTAVPSHYASPYVSAITFIRLMAFAFLMAIVLRKR